jgi:hypothetical protein
MQEIGYISWSMIPADVDPTTGETTNSNPPMIPTLAMDKNVSLVFQLPSAAPRLFIELETTAISSGAADEAPLEIFTGPTTSSYRSATATWDRKSEGLNVKYSTEIGNADTYVKMFRPDAPALVINRIGFSAP